MDDVTLSPAVREILKRPILVIGCGSIGQRHVKNLLALGATRVWAHDIINSVALRVAEQYNITPYNATRECFERPVAAIVCTPTAEHADNTRMRYGMGIRNIFIEKPISDTDTSYYDADLYEIVDDKLANTFVACNLRFTKGLQRVKQLIDDGAIGKVVSARAQFGQYLPDWRPNTDHKKSYSANKSMGGGVVLDCIHEFDYLSWLLGDIVDAKAFTARLTDVTVDTEDVAEYVLRFKSGALGSVHADYVRKGYDRRLEIVGTDGSIIWQMRRSGAEGINCVHHDSMLLPEYTHGDVNDMYVAEMIHFLKVCAGEEKSMNTISDAYKLLEVVLRAKE